MSYGRRAWPAVFVVAIGSGALLAAEKGSVPAGPLECVTLPLSIDPHLVDSSVGFARAVFAADVDGDTFTDILSASSNSDTIAWYENNGASPPGFTERVITNQANSAWDVFAIDIDCDDDIDVLSAATLDAAITWYENDGMPVPSWTPHDITTSASAARAVFAIDLDGDDDIDVLSASQGDDTIAWYENDGMMPPGFTEHIITTNADSAYDVFAIDVDGDLNIDVLSASKSDDKIAWYESDGGKPPTFIEHVITTNADGAQSVYAIDLDGDLDIDVLSASPNDDTVAWYENDGMMPPGFTERIITTGADNVQEVFAIELEEDGDVDVLSASLNDDKIAWYQNDGAQQPSFTERIIRADANGAHAVYAADLDGDLDPDVCSTAIFDDTVDWFEMSPPEFGSCCLSDDSCMEAICLADCG